MHRVLCLSKAFSELTQNITSTWRKEIKNKLYKETNWCVKLWIKLIGEINLIDEKDKQVYSFYCSLVK